MRMFLEIIFILIILILAFQDFLAMRLPDKLTLPLLFLGLLNGALAGFHSFLLSILSAIVAGVFFWLIATVFPGSIGLGDVKFITALASYLSFPYIVIALLLASFTGSLISGIFIIIWHHGSFKKHIPFGPYLALGALISLFWGNTLIDCYLRLIH